MPGLSERSGGAWVATDQEILAVLARCQWHKRENVVSYVNPKAREKWRRRLREAQETPEYAEAKRLLSMMAREMKSRNESAASGLMEGMEETLRLQRLGLFRELGRSFKTTNLIENVNRLLEDQTGRVCRWRTSDQRRRWVATAMLNIEPRLQRIKGHKHLTALREAMRILRGGNREEVQKAA